MKYERRNIRMETARTRQLQSGYLLTTTKTSNHSPQDILTRVMSWTECDSFKGKYHLYRVNEFGVGDRFIRHTSSFSRLVANGGLVLRSFHRYRTLYVCILFLITATVFLDPCVDVHFKCIPGCVKL